MLISYGDRAELVRIVKHGGTYHGVGLFDCKNLNGVFQASLALPQLYSAYKNSVFVNKKCSLGETGLLS